MLTLLVSLSPVLLSFPSLWCIKTKAVKLYVFSQCKPKPVYLINAKTPLNSSFFKSWFFSSEVFVALIVGKDEDEMWMPGMVFHYLGISFVFANLAK